MITYKFYCGDYEVERGFKKEPTDSELGDAFDVWVLECSQWFDDIDVEIENGDVGYYEI